MSDTQKKEKKLILWYIVNSLLIVCLVATVTEMLVDASTYTLTVYKSGTGASNGTVTSDNGTITWSGNTGTFSFDNVTSNVYFTPSASAGAVFSSWSGCTSVSNNICALVPTDNKTITATFNGVDTYTLTVGITGIGRGTVKDSTGTLYVSTDNLTTGDNATKSDNSSFTSATFSLNKIVYLTATPKISNYILSFWSGCDNIYDNGTCAVTMSSSRSVTARFSGLYNVTYNIPYISPNTNGVTYCIVSNFSLDNATTDGFAVMSLQGSVASQKYYYFTSDLSIKRKKTTFLMFYSNIVAINNTLSTTDNSTRIDYSSEVNSNSLYGVKLKFTSTGGTGISGINCKNIIMACFQGTTTPRRNLVGYTCEDNSTAGPGGKPILIGY